MSQLRIATTKDEKEATNAILQALAKYMLDHGVDVRFLSEMKLQKIVFKTIEELDLPITRSWYIRGCMVHPGGTLTGNVTRKKLEELIKNQDALTINQDIYTCFDTINVDKIFFTERNKFLRDLYNTMEPARFRKEYAPNNELIISLEGLSRGNCDNISTAISENISKLYLGMQGDELFDNVSDSFYDFLDFIEDISIEVEGAVEEGAEITPHDLEFFHHLNTTYHSNVWIEPASIISIETVQGLSAKKVIKQRKNYLSIAAEKIESSLEELKQKSEELNLQLSEKHLEKAYNKSYEHIGETAANHLTEMWKIYAK